MSLLDQLKQEVDSRKKVEELRQQQIQERENFYRTEMLPRMVNVYNYLDELVKTLEYLDRDIRADYYISGIGEFNDLRQSNYRLSVDSTQNMKRILLSFQCEKEGEKTELVVKGEKLIEQQVSNLLGAKLEFDQKIRHNVGGRKKESTFIVRHFIPIALIIEADVDTSEYMVRIHNLPKLGSTKQVLPALEMNDTFMDSLGRFVLRMDDLFLRQELSKEALNDIRRKLAHEEKRRAKELGEKPPPSVITYEEEEGILNKVKGKFGRLFSGEEEL